MHVINLLRKVKTYSSTTSIVLCQNIGWWWMLWIQVIANNQHLLLFYFIYLSLPPKQKRSTCHFNVIVQFRFDKCKTNTLEVLIAPTYSGTYFNREYKKCKHAIIQNSMENNYDMSLKLVNVTKHLAFNFLCAST